MNSDSPKFSIQIENQFGYSWDHIKDIVSKTEEFGYHSFYICDHFFLNKEAEERDALEAYTVLTAAAMMTEKIHLGTLVTGQNYRNPALLAKIVASIDAISGGRMEFGIGAGWKQVEYEAYGYEFPSVKDRMDQLEETIQIVKKLFTENRATFEGTHYQLNDAVFSPKPHEDILFLIGGGGEKRTLKMVAQYADYMNLPFTPIDQIPRKLDALKEHCRAVDRDYDDVGKSYFGPARVVETEDELDEFIKSRAERSSRSLDEITARVKDPENPGSWFGTPEQVRERIEYMQSFGFDYFFLQQPFDLSSDVVSKFATLVKNKYF